MEREARRELFGSDFLSKPPFLAKSWCRSRFPLGNPGKNWELWDDPRMRGGGKLGKNPGMSPFYSRMLQFSWDELDCLDISGNLG